jgi:hypothetical protein
MAIQKKIIIQVVCLGMSLELKFILEQATKVQKGWRGDGGSLLYNGNRVFPGGKVRPGRAADHSSTSTAAVMEE